jgi:translation initiation factor IF-3
VDGRNMVMVVAPHRNKSDVKTELNAVRAANKQAAREAKGQSAPGEAPVAETPAAE